MSQQKTWGGRFSGATDNRVEVFTESISLDRRLYRQDIAASQAHARMLAEVGLLTADEAARIMAALDDIAGEIERGEFAFSIQLEDIHTHIERTLIERLGDVGRKLHTGRSRNDQVVTDVKLWVREAIDTLDGRLRELQAALLEAAERDRDLVLPGYTHLQRAQPVLAAHYFLAYIEKYQRDRERLADCRKRVNWLPLGAAALAGTTYPIDRERVARELGFDGVCANSLDAVSDRDFAIEFAACGALVMVHLSRFCEELVLWMNPRFGFVRLPDAFCTGSSIMPQKKNPDVPELARGKSGRVVGDLVALLTLMKGQPLAYNKDNQEDKEPLFDVADTLVDSLAIFAALVPGIEADETAMRTAAREGFATATDLADYLVRKGMAFRDAHEAVARAVREAANAGLDLADLPLPVLRQFAPLVADDVYAVLGLEGSLAARNHPGGTAPEQVHAAVRRARAELSR